MTTRTVSLALHELFVKDGTLVCEHGTAFDLESYSRFKYGYTTPAQDYGFELAALFVGKFPELALEESRRVLVTSAPYKFLASASHSIAAAFQNALNCYRIAAGLEPAMSLRATRFTVGSDSYANGSVEERLHSYAKMPRHIDKELILDAVVIFIDDVRITGSTEDRFRELVMPHKPHALCVLHVAKVDEEQARLMPSIENVMNKFRPPTLDALAADIKTGNYKLNSRALRTILEYGDTDPEAFRGFLSRLDNKQLEEMFVALMSGTQEMWNRLPNGRNLLASACRQRGLRVATLMATCENNTLAVS